MKTIRVQLVKYDTAKTKKRSRKDLLVDFQSESAVIEQLEKIHKGDEVVAIHEILWDEKQIKEVERLKKIDQKLFFFGTVKFFDAGKGFGFIQPDEEMDDIFFHQTSLANEVPRESDRVDFKISEGPKGLCAIQVRIIDSE